MNTRERAEYIVMMAQSMDAVEVAQAYLDQQWIPVSERLPDEEGRYLIIYRQKQIVRPFIGDYIIDGNGGRWSSLSDAEILFWAYIPDMPLPPPPESE